MKNQGCSSGHYNKIHLLQQELLQQKMIIVVIYVLLHQFIGFRCKSYLKTSNLLLQKSQSILIALYGLTAHSMKCNTSTTLEEVRKFLGFKMSLGQHKKPQLLA